MIFTDKKAGVTGVEICRWANEAREKEEGSRLAGPNGPPFPFLPLTVFSLSPIPFLGTVPAQKCSRASPGQMLYFSLGTLALTLSMTNDYYQLFLSICDFHFPYNAICFPPKKFAQVFFQFLLGLTLVVPRKIENNT